ncbi:Jag N-terminal domain-containing protein [Desulfohalobiaceae bacterium Ax17]|uniref:RNA-binding cell elongation regulator Jag/EloR n=1 Tax=Desulfovulcanus ferrireducens TaxID=2831190 RepID=UPI00207BB7E5|nr:RNA-binding cell elongation regulator Jag/EloR [Desulfovulcanus ferrireducens]MBT8763302.1 Jag N-terminal domain-containing protein [Desulfovulcanus ferrireducens]
MDEFVEFSGKNVDEAIAKACEHFQTDRDQLEIEIITGGSSGIFGLVGVKKAKIKAKKRNNLRELEQLIEDIITNLTRPLTPNPEISVDMQSEPITVTIKDKENSGLIIGRDGQTITALQYIANRIIAKKWPGASRIQLDTGDYRQKQNEKLKKTAIYLAQRAKRAGKTMSTQPLSSYHRRLIHLALQDDHSVQTKSKGEGPMKRVLIMPRKRRKRTFKSKESRY